MPKWSLGTRVVKTGVAGAGFFPRRVRTRALHLRHQAPGMNTAWRWGEPVGLFSEKRGRAPKLCGLEFGIAWAIVGPGKGWVEKKIKLF